MTKLSEEILSLRAQGKSYKQIQRELGCSSGTIAYYCGIGQREKTISNGLQTKARRRAKVAELKSVPCADCGQGFPTECMDFDHLGDDKTAGISELINRGTWQMVLDEIAKCEVVCSNCHRIRTRRRSRDTVYKS